MERPHGQYIQVRSHSVTKKLLSRNVLILKGGGTHFGTKIGVLICHNFYLEYSAGSPFFAQKEQMFHIVLQELFGVGIHFSFTSFIYY